jgi:hypothetical protein
MPIDQELAQHREIQLDRFAHEAMVACAMQALFMKYPEVHGIFLAGAKGTLDSIAGRENAEYVADRIEELVARWSPPESG